MADVTLFQAWPRVVPNVTSTSPRVCGTFFLTTRPMWLKAIRFYRATTAMYGKIDGRIYNYNYSASTWVAVPGTDISITLTAGQGPTGWVEMVYPTPIKLQYSTFGGGYYQVAVKFPGGTNNKIPFAANWWFPYNDDTAPTTAWNTQVHENTPLGGLGLSTLYAGDGRTQSAFLMSSTMLQPTQDAAGDHGLDIRVDELDPNDPPTGPPLWRTQPYSGVAQYPASDRHTVTIQGEFGPYEDVRGTTIGWDFEVTAPAWLVTLRVYGPSYAFTYLGGTWLRVYERQDDGTTWLPLAGTTIQITDNYSVGGGYGGWKEVTTSGFPALIVGRRYRIQLTTDRYPIFPDYFASGPGASPRVFGPVRALPGGYMLQPSSVPGNQANLAIATTPTNHMALLDFYATVQDPYADTDGGGYGDPTEPNETAERLWGVGAPYNFLLMDGPGLGQQEFEITAPVRAHGIRFYRPTMDALANTGTIALMVRAPIVSYIVVPGTAYRFNLANHNRTGWVYARFPIPVKLAVGTRYVVVVIFDDGYIETTDYFETGPGAGPDAITRGRLRIPEKAVQTGLDNARHNNWVDVTVTPWTGTPTGAKGSATEPSDALRLWGTDPVPARASFLSNLFRTSTYNTSLDFEVTEDATGHGLRFYRTSPYIRGNVVARIYVMHDIQDGNWTGTELLGADVTFDDNVNIGWQYAAFRSPVKLRANQRYQMMFWWPDGMPADPYFYNPDGDTGDPDFAQETLRRQSESGEIINGILKVPAPANCFEGSPFRFHFAGVTHDNIAWPRTPMYWNFYTDISVTPGTGSAVDRQEHPDALNSRGNTRPPPSDYGDIGMGNIPDTVAHDIAFATNVTVYGVRSFTADLRYVTGEVAIFRAATGTIVPGTRTAMPQTAGIPTGWMYTPFATPVVLEENVKYRVATSGPYGNTGVPVGRGKALETGLISDISTWHNSPPDPYMSQLPNYPDLNDYMLDLSYSVGGDPSAGEVIRTLFHDDVSLEGPFTDLTVFYSSGAPGRNLGIRFGTNEVTYAIGMRFWRPANYIPSPDDPPEVDYTGFDFDGPVIGRIYAVYNDPNDRGEGTAPGINRGTLGRIVSGSEVVIELDPDNLSHGWVSGRFATPVELRPGILYCAVLWFPGTILIDNGYFLPGQSGDTGTGVRMGPKGTLYYGGTQWAPNSSQGVSKASSKPEYPWKGIYMEGTNAARPAGHLYFIDVMTVDKPPDYLPMKQPRQPLAHSIYGRFPFLADPPVGRSIMAGLEFYVTKPSYVLAYRWPRTNPSAQRRPVIVGLYEMTGEDTATPIPASFGIMLPMPALWQSAHLSPAIKVEPGKRYKLVMQFNGAHPMAAEFIWDGASYTPFLEDKVRGPLVIPSNEHAMGKATSTWAPANAFIYPIWPSSGEGLNDGGHYLDLVVSEFDPDALPSEVEYSLFEQRLPPTLAQYALRKAIDSETGDTLEEYRNGGLELYFTQEVYVTQIHYWRSPFPASTVIEKISIYEAIDAFTGEEVPGTAVIVEPWPDDISNQSGGIAWAEGWVTINLSAPVKLKAEQRYRIGAFYPYRPDQLTIPMSLDYWRFGAGGGGLFSGPMVAPSKEQALEKMQGPESFYLAREWEEYGPEYPGTAADVYGVSTFSRQYWLDITILDTAPRNVDGGTVVKTMSVGRKERRSAGVEATDAPVVQLSVAGQTIGGKYIESSPVHELSILATPFSGQSLIQQGVGIEATALAISKHVEGGVADHEQTLQTRITKIKKAVVDDATTEIGVYGRAYEAFRWAPIPREAITFPFTFNPQNIRFIAQNIMTRQFLHMDLPIVNPQITWRLSGPFELTGTISPPFADILDIMMDEWSTFIHVEYMGTILGSGILMPWSADEQTLNIEAIGVSTYPHGIPYMDYYHDFFPDVMVVIRELWRHIQSFPNGDIGLLLPSGTMGVPLFGKIHHDEETGDLLGWEEWSLHWTDFVDCGSFIDNLAVSTPFDYREVQVWNAAHTDVLHGINFGYPRLGGKRDDLKFEYGGNIVGSVSISEPEDAYVSDVILKGSGEGPDQIYVWIAAIMWDRLRRVLVMTDEQVADPQMGYGIADQELYRRLYSRGVEKLVVEAFHLFAPLGTYNVGDDILIDAMIPFVGEFMMWHRITAITFDRDTGLATLEVARSESFRYGRPRPAGT